MSPETMQLARAATALEDWPTLNQAYGCLDCNHLFKNLPNERCPSCASRAIIDVAVILNSKPE